MASRHPKQNVSKAIHPKDSSEQNTENAPGEIHPAPKVLPSPNNHDYSDESTERTKPWGGRRLLESLTFITILAYTVVSGLQWSEMIKSNETNRQALESVQRAIVTWNGFAKVLPTIEHSPLGDVKCIEFAINWENAGATPAIGIIENFNAAHLPDEPTDEQFKGNPQLADLGTAVLGPKGIHKSHPVKRPASYLLGTPPDMTKGKFFFWGWMVYHDIFKGTSPHLTEFCQQLEDVLDNDDKVQFRTRPCRRHNCVDNYCQDYKSFINLTPSPPPFPK